MRQPSRNTVAGPVDDLATEAGDLIAARIRAEIPGILDDNQQVLRATAITAVEQGLQSIDAAGIAQGVADQVKGGIMKAAIVTVVATSLLTVGLVRLTA